MPSLYLITPASLCPLLSVTIPQLLTSLWTLIVHTHLSFFQAEECHPFNHSSEDRLCWSLFPFSEPFPDGIYGNKKCKKHSGHWGVCMDITLRGLLLFSFPFLIIPSMLLAFLSCY